MSGLNIITQEAAVCDYGNFGPRVKREMAGILLRLVERRCWGWEGGWE